MSALAPYNFVELPARIIPAEEEAVRPVSNRYEAARHTGWLDLEMTALTPLYTRGVLGTGGGFPAPIATVGQGEAVQAADFFHRGEHEDARLCRPVLPGSSLRGMFETVFEIMAQSRPRFVSSHRPFYRYFAAAGQPELREFYAREFRPATDLVAGVLRRYTTQKGVEWRLEVSDYAPSGYSSRGFVAVSVRGLPPTHSNLRGRRTGGDLYDARPQQVVVTGLAAPLLQGAQALTVPEATLTSPGAVGALNGYLILPGPDLNRRPPNQREPARSWYQVILEPHTSYGSREYVVPEEVYNDYLEWGRTAHGSRFSTSSGDTPRRLIDGSPAFALVSAQNLNEVSTIGANMMLSLRHTTSLKEVAQRSHQTNTPTIDMAQALFGYVPTAAEAAEGRKAIRGRVFVEDTVCSSESWYFSPDPVRVPLPHLGPKTTAIQMYLQQPNPQLSHYSSAEARVRGFKRYWHQSDSSASASLRRNSDTVASTETRICPVKHDTKFTGRVRFENLTDAELGGLYACIQLPWNQEQQICLAHKFGMGKAFGLGSLRVEETSMVLLDVRRRYTTFRRSSEQIIAGQFPEAEARQILSRSYQAFVKYVGKNKTLWRRPALKALANLLAWEPKPQEEIRAVGIETNPNKPDFDALARQWKDRVPLGKVINRIKYPILDVIALDAVNEPVPAEPNISKTERVTEPVMAVVHALPEIKSYHIGDALIVTVQRRFGRSQGDVLVDDGTLEGRLLRNVQIGDAGTGEKLPMRVTAINNSGMVTGVKRDSTI